MRQLYAGFLPILCKQIPYAIGQFTVNEFCHEAVFRSMSEERVRAAQASRSTMFGINLGSGIIAGFAAAILSQVCYHVFKLLSNFEPNAFRSQPIRC